MATINPYKNPVLGSISDGSFILIRRLVLKYELLKFSKQRLYVVLMIQNQTLDIACPSGYLLLRRSPFEYVMKRKKSIVI